MPPQTKSKKYKIQLFLEQKILFHTNINNKIVHIPSNLKLLKSQKKLLGYVTFFTEAIIYQYFLQET